MLISVRRTPPGLGQHRTGWAEAGESVTELTKFEPPDTRTAQRRRLLVAHRNGDDAALGAERDAVTKRLEWTATRVSSGTPTPAANSARALGSLAFGLRFSTERTESPKFLVHLS